MQRPPIEQRLVSEPDPAHEGVPLVIRAGFLVAGGVLAAIVASVPGALRMEGGLSLTRALEQWVVLTAITTPFAVLAVATLRQAREGIRILAGEHRSLLAIGVVWWSVLELGILSVFAALLKKTTHQTSLAGVTFAAFALASGIVVAYFARRATAMLARGGEDLQRMGLLMAGVSALIVLALVAVRTSRVAELHTAGVIFDFVAFALVSSVASLRIHERFRAIAIVGVPAAVLVMIIGFTTLRFDPKLRDALAETAPAHGVVIDLFR